MTTTTPTDPAEMFREFVGQWEKLANDYGTNLLGRPEAARAMHGITAVGMKAQETVHEGMAKLLAAANMPTRADIVEINTRLSAIEACLLRLEAATVTADIAPRPVTNPPRRTRRPETQT